MPENQKQNSKSSKEDGKGRQKPRIAKEPGFIYSDGDDAAELVSAYGYDLDPWQKRVLTCWLGRDEDDRFTATSAGLAVPRQNGKNAVLEARMLYGLVSIGEHILFTAQEVKTARKAFLRLSSFFENREQFPELADMVRSVRRTNGQEAIYLKESAGGGQIEFSARSRSAARGFTVDVVILDEAQELTDEQIEALIPTLSAAPKGNRQFIYTGTPTPPSCPGKVWEHTRESALKGENEHLAWHEWSVEECIRPAAKWDDVADLIFETNPAMGYRLDLEFCKNEFSTMSFDGFSRERLGWWAPMQQEIDKVIPQDMWEKTTIKPENVPQEGKRACGVKFAPDGATVALSAAVKPSEGKQYFELLQVENTAEGVSWLVDWLAEKQEKISTVVIDGFSGADALIERLAPKVPKNYIIRPRTGDVIASASTFLDAIKSETATHIESRALDISAAQTTKRRIGNRGGWGFNGADACVIESAALALWGVNNTKRDPEQRQVIF